MRKLAAACLTLVLLGAVSLRGQEEVASPLTEAQVTNLVAAQTPAADLVAQIRSRGISFKVTPQWLDTLKKLKVKPEVLEALTAPATLELRLNVPGAKVSVDGEDRGAAGPDGQARLAGLVAGRHLVRLEATGYVADRFDVFLKPGETRQFERQLTASVSSAAGALGTRVKVQAGTEEDSVLGELEFEKDPGKRLERLAALMQQYEASPLMLLFYGQRQDAYLEAQRFDQSIADGQELLRRDPANFSARIRLARAYRGKGDIAAALEQVDAARKLVEALRAEVPPQGFTPDDWATEQREILPPAESDLKNLAYTLFVAATEVSDAAQKSRLLERYLEVFPQSDYRTQAYVSLALAYQQQGNLEKMLAWGGKALEANPNEVTMLVLVGDVLSDRGQELPRARELGARLLNLMTNEPEKARAAGWTDEQWAGLRQTWEGVAHSVLGQVLMYEEKTGDAIKEFRVASPLLKGEPQLYARNLYRLGYACAKLGGAGNLQTARDALTEAAAMNTPYQQPARDLLAKVQQKLAGR